MALRLLALVLIPMLLSFLCWAGVNESEGQLQVDPEEDLNYPNETETSETPFVSEDPEAIREAILDVAYFLRSGKFNDFDRRYAQTKEEAKKRLYESFPVPPLRIVHWEVKQYCQENFYECVKYLQEALLADLRREVDSAHMMYEQNWTLSSAPDAINRSETECQRLFQLDWNLALPFAGPLERFQWRTSASYYMCWYTMKEQEELKHFGEPCDDIGHCMTDARHGDPRAKDQDPFACSQYSFCPDPCCPNKAIFLDLMTECWLDANQNPCYVSAPSESRQCLLERRLNQDFASAVLNRWNVTCLCAQNGYIYDSRFGICIDVDECLTEAKCDALTEECLNLPGGYTCLCKWGLVDLANGEGCVPNAALALAENQKEISSKENLAMFPMDRPGE